MEVKLATEPAIEEIPSRSRIAPFNTQLCTYSPDQIIRNFARAET